jgi:hypothetical protein
MHQTAVARVERCLSIRDGFRCLARICSDSHRTWQVTGFGAPLPQNKPYSQPLVDAAVPHRCYLVFTSDVRPEG